MRLSVMAILAGLSVGFSGFAAAQEKSFAPGTTFRDCPECPEMVAIPAGSFVMGSSPGELDHDQDESPQHEVKIASFAMGKTEVTFAQYDACTAENACPRALDNSWGRGDRPVINVTWDDAKQYVAWLSRKTGKTYRLPSEAEWEYAARAGTKTRFYCGSDDACLASVAWYELNSNERTQPVARKSPNAFGLYDMHGNVWEWLEDCYNDDYEGAPADGSAWRTGNCELRVRRGGAWGGPSWSIRTANRHSFSSDEQEFDLGFRVARTN